MRSSMRPSAWRWCRPTAGGSKSTGRSAIWSAIPEAELLARTFQDITHPEDLESDLDNVRRIIAGEIRSYQMEKRYVHAGGHLVTVLLNVSLVRDAQGQPRYFISQIQDITERKLAEQALRTSTDEISRTNRGPPGRDRGEEARGGCGRRRQPLEERIPGQHEPRDSHAVERRRRHDGARARHRPQRRAARVSGHGQGVRRVAADRHQRHPRLLEDRGRKARRRRHPVRPERLPRDDAQTAGHAGAREGTGAGL